jgi:ABC-2 type transport system permease protein
MALATLLYLGLLAAFVWLGLGESSVLGFTGLSRVLLNISSAIIVAFPLIVLIGTHGAIVRGKVSGFCELMLSQPCRRSDWFRGLLLARLIVLLAPLVVIMFGCTMAAAFLEPEPGLTMVALRSLSISSSLVFSFIGIGLYISARAPTIEKALVWSLVVWVLSAAVHDVLLVATLLRTAIPPHLVFALAALNPAEAARVGILTSIDPELSVLGPVGFWLANTLGNQASLAVAVLWPLALGLVSVWRAGARLERADLVA